VSGSSGESSSSDSEKEKEGADDKLHQFLKQEAAAAQGTENNNKPRQAKTHKLSFLAQQGGSQVVISVWRCLLDESIGVNSENTLLALQNGLNSPKWTILLCSGGRLMIAYLLLFS
jgi:hypothetical protein